MRQDAGRFGMSTNKPPRGDALWPWYFGTVLYLGFGALVLYDRWGEVGSLLAPPAEPPVRLPLNSIGDILAGFFAPLAFLWLFVATQLQRKELRLQREELADTRRVLDEQKTEMQRSAEESNLQTSIMQRNLDAANSKQIYDEFNLRMYFGARSIYLDKNCHIVVVEKSYLYYDKGRLEWQPTTYPLTAIKPQIYLSPTDASTVDAFFEAISILVGQVEKVTADDEKSRIYAEPDNEDAVRFLDNVINFVNRTIEDSTTFRNELINLRISNLDILSLKFDCDVIKSRIRPSSAMKHELVI